MSPKETAVVREHEMTGSTPGRDAEVSATRRALRLKLLRDLVSEGLYRVRPDDLAERLLTRLGPDLGSHER